MELAKDSPSNFQRDLRHLDSTICREVHKVAVIFVGKDQQVGDKFDLQLIKI